MLVTLQISRHSGYSSGLSFSIFKGVVIASISPAPATPFLKTLLGFPCGSLEIPVFKSFIAHLTSENDQWGVLLCDAFSSLSWQSFSRSSLYSLRSLSIVSFYLVFIACGFKLIIIF